MQNKLWSWFTRSDNSQRKIRKSTHRLARRRLGVEQLEDRIVLSTWTGSVDSDWFNAANWNGEVPSETIDAVFPFGGNVDIGSAAAFSKYVGVDESLATVNVDRIWTILGGVSVGNSESSDYQATLHLTTTAGTPEIPLTVAIVDSTVEIANAVSQDAELIAEGGLVITSELDINVGKAAIQRGV